MNARKWVGRAALALLSGMLLMLVSCGGGVGSGGTGAEAMVARGTVSGFGSVIVDGVRYDDRNIAARREDAPGVEQLTEVQLGEQVEIDFDADGAPSGMRVEATLAGAVDRIDGATRFLVLGQPVLVNTDAATGPVTQFAGGYAGAADVMAGDAVEVHGVIVPEASGPVLRATRIERLAALPGYLKVSGLVTALSADGFSLGALQVHTANAVLEPSGGTLREGALVTVYARPAGRSGSADSPQLQADAVRLRDGGAAGTRLTVGGNLADLDSSLKRFRLGALIVDYSAATLSPPALALAEGQYLRVAGQLALDGTLRADSITLRDGRNEPESELKGNILGFDAATQRFTVRGVNVDASGATLQGCPADGLAEGLYVEIEGRLDATGVLAGQVHCESEPSGGTVGRKGTVGSVDTTQKRFVLTTSGGTVTVGWNDNTVFEHTTPDTLDGQRVEVEGVFDGEVLVAKKVNAED